MKALGMISKGVGFAWIAVVVAYTIWIGIAAMLRDADDTGVIYVAALVAAPGAGLVWLGNRLLGKPQGT